MTYYEKALEFTGVPYKSGGIDKNGVDCSGLVNAATGQTKRVWNTEDSTPPPGHTEIKIKSEQIDGFVKSLKKGDVLLWKGHVAFYDSGTRLFHARKTGTNVGFTNDLKLYWLKEKGFPKVYRQN